MWPFRGKPNAHKKTSELQINKEILSSGLDLWNTGFDLPHAPKFVELVG